MFQKTEIVSFGYSLFRKDKRRSDIEFSLFSTGIYIREMIIIGNKPDFVGTLYWKTELPQVTFTGMPNVFRGRISFLI